MKKITTKKIIEFKKPKPRSPILEEIKQRFSPRFFKAEKVNNKILNSIFEAARWAPSGYNHQPWYFYYASQGTLAYKKIYSSLSERNQWAKTAPVFIIACYIKECEHGINKYAQYDLGSAVMSMIIQAQSSGIYARQMGLFGAKKLQKLLHIPKEYTPFVIIAAGKLGDYSTISQKLLKQELRKRERKVNIVKRYGK